MSGIETDIPVTRAVTVEGRVVAWCLIAIAAAILVLAAVRYLPSPLRFDESEWPPQVEGVLRHGTPMLTSAVDRRLFVRSYYGYDAHYGMWHPPLFVYSLAIGRAAFGDSTVAVRVMPLAWGLLALWLAWRLARSSLPADPVLRAVPVAVAILSPLVLDGLFYMDIDNTILAAAMFALACVHVSMDTAGPWRRSVVLGAVLAIALWAKLTTPVLLVAAIAAHRWLQRGFTRALVEAVAVGMIGAGLFGATYALYCAILHYPAAFMFDVSYLGKRSAYLSIPSIGRVLHSVWWNVVWVSPPLVLAGVWTVVRRVRRYLREWVVEDMDVLLIFAILTFFEYTVAAGLIGKYTVPGAMALAIVVGVECARGLATLRTSGAARILAVAAALATLHLLVVPPIVIRAPDGFAGAPAGLRALLLNARNIDVLIAVTAGLAACGAWRRLLATAAPARSGLIAALLWLMVVNPIAQARVLVASADRSPLRPFEEYGFNEAVQWLNGHAATGETVLCPKDVGAAFAGRYYALEPAAPDWTEEAEDVLRRPDLRFVVDSNAYPLLRDRRLLERAGFAPIAAAGDFVIYGRAVTSTPTGQVTPVPPRPQ